MNSIRPIAICLFLHNNKILVAEGYDPVKDEHFYRPLGGGIEFGEHSTEAICRELMEEVGLEGEPGSLRYLGALENRFHFNGVPGHEIVLVYDGTLKDPGSYEQTMLLGKEANGEEFGAVWKDVEEFGDGRLILYPPGVIQLLR